jgi:hypothetical protein
MNQYPGYCIDCERQVKAGHGDLKKRGGKYVVSCGRGKSTQPVSKPPAKPAPERPTGMRLSNINLSSSNASLTLKFQVNGVGLAESHDPYTEGRVGKSTRWDNEPLMWADKPEDAGKSLRELRPAEAAKHDALCDAAEALYAALAAAGQIARESKYEINFLLSIDEEETLKRFVADAKTALLTAILDGSASITVSEVGCDFPHPQICGIRLPGADQDVEYALVQHLLGEFHLQVDGSEACKDLAGAIRAQQAKIEQSNAAKEEHRLKRAAGHHVVAMKRCWECGRTQILGELDDNFGLVRMPEPIYRECINEQKSAHARSLATVPSGTLLSSVGFSPDPQSSFEFRIVESDWYCGC